VDSTRIYYFQITAVYVQLDMRRSVGPATDSIYEHIVMPREQQ
jgi:hypothetical protein